MHSLQGSVVIPAHQIIMDRAAGRQILGDIAPLASRAKDVHQAVHYLSDVDSPLVAARFGGRDQRFYLRPFFVRQVMGVTQPTAFMAATGLNGPHAAPRDSVPGIDSHLRRAGQEAIAN